MVWATIGAAGGIYAYRKGQQWWITAREQGATLTAQQLAMNAAAMAQSVRSTLAKANATSEVITMRIPGSAAARVVQQGGKDGLR
jgi:hypothetical protein